MLHTVNISAVLIPGRAIAETRFQLQAASFKRHEIDSVERIKDLEYKISVLREY